MTKLYHLDLKKNDLSSKYFVQARRDKLVHGPDFWNLFGYT